MCQTGEGGAAGVRTEVRSTTAWPLCHVERLLLYFRPLALTCNNVAYKHCEIVYLANTTHRCREKVVSFFPVK